MPAEGPLRSNEEAQARAALAELFGAGTDDVATKLDEFPKYVRRQKMTRLLSLYDVFCRVLNTKGSIVNCGVFRGFSAAAFLHFSAILEPANLTRRIYGFDTFEGFPNIGKEDASSARSPQVGDLAAPSLDELQRLFVEHDRNRYLGHIPKIQLVAGDATKTIPEFVAENPHLVISLLFLDFDLYAPTRVAIEAFVPRMVKGSLIVFDELDNPLWPGESKAVLDTLGLGKLRLQRLPYDPYLGFAEIE